MEEKDSFMDKFKDLILNPRIIILFFFIILSLVAINYTFDSEGIVINGVVPASLSEKSGFEYDSSSSIRNLEKILYLDNEKILNQEDFYSYLLTKTQDNSLKIITDKKEYLINYNITENQSLSEELGLSVRDAARNNIKLGIELEGGSRLILEPQTELTDDEYDLLISSLQNRLDIYGASGTKVNKLEDAFSNKRFVIVESTSSNKNDIFELIKRQGKFEAKVGNTSVFNGEKNVLQVFTDAQHAGLEGCSEGSEGYICTFGFSIEIDSQGGDSFFNQTKQLSIVNGYLSEQVTFLMDSKEITSLNIASSFKYQKITNPQITVSGNPQLTRDKAIESAKKEMKFLQTLLSTKTLPTELDIVQSYSISSSLGQKLLDNAFIVAITSVLIVSGIVALRYRNLGIFVGIFFALALEIIVVFGVAAFMRLSIDLAAIGGLIAAIGTGVDDQIIITDEHFRKREKKMSSRKKLKAAFYIIMIAYFTTLAAMIPLYFAGLKILQGFAFMILIGVTVGVFITRPAYANYLRIIMTTRKQRKQEEEEDRF